MLYDNIFAWTFPVNPCKKGHDTIPTAALVCLPTVHNRQTQTNNFNMVAGPVNYLVLI